MRLIGRSGSRGAKRPYSMSLREIEVLQWVAHSRSAQKIAVTLNIANRTIDAHALSAVRKWGRPTEPMPSPSRYAIALSKCEDARRSCK
jgi:DNA-binding CsgD family transcriptional regulator